MESNMKQVFVVYETDAWHSTSNRDCKGIYTSKRSAINAIVRNFDNESFVVMSLIF